MPFKQDEQITSFSYKDPYHYTLEEIENIARETGYSIKLINDFYHPRNQKMIEFTKKEQI